MPYSTTVKLKEDCSVTKKNCSPSCKTSTDSFPNTYIQESFSRSGTNTVGGIRSKLEPRRKLYKLVPRIVYSGPRLAYKVLNFRTGRYHWARQPIKVMRLVRVPWPKKKKSSKRVYSLPNRLNFEKVNNSFFGPNHVDGVYNSTYFRSYEGDLWAGFVPLGTYTALGPNPQNYLSASSSSPFDNAETKLRATLVPRFYERVKNQSFNLAQAFAERRQTAKMISDAAVRLAKGFVALKKGNFASATAALFPPSTKTIANDWLIFQYGVKPLLSDIDGAAKHLAMGEKVEFNVTVKDRIDVPRTLVWTESANNGIKATTTVHTEGFVEVTYKARLRATAPAVRELARLGVLNPVALAWELLPYSFVADWFIPIGNYLSNMDAFAGLELVYATTTAFHSETLTYTRSIGGKDGSNYAWGAADVGFVSKKVRCNRAVLTSPPPLAKPSFKDPVSATHFANALALIRQLHK